jgi:hypothetical protein
VGRLNELIERNTMRTAEAVQRVAAATAYSPEQDLRALLSGVDRVVEAVESVEARIADGLLVEASVQ